MTLNVVLLMLFTIATIVAGITLVYRSAKRFKLSDEQKKRIAAREEQQKNQDNEYK